MTLLKDGIFIHIDEMNLEKLKENGGFLETENYPDAYKDIVVKDEVGRFLFFRFILM